MHYSTAASMAVLAYAVGSQAAAAPQPYRLAVMPLIGKSLMARDTIGYQPEESHCGKGTDCASACGAAYTQCGSQDDTVHCFNPTAQVCCPDNSGNSCDAGYYCASDHQKQTWCCPEGMDLAACAAAYTVKGGLVSATPSSTSTTSTTSQTPTTTSTPSTTAEPTTSTTSSFSSTTAWNTTTVVDDETTTVCPTTSAGTTSAWYGSNSTITSATLTAPSNTVVVPPTSITPIVKPTSAATMTTVSGLLLAVAGFVALL